MYTADASINAKVKGASGWRDLLKLLGFRFQKASNGIPDSVFFPSVTSGVADKLAVASNHLHALLGKLVVSYARNYNSIYEGYTFVHATLDRFHDEADPKDTSVVWRSDSFTCLRGV